MKTFPILSLLVLSAISAHAELRTIGVLVTRAQKSKVLVTISSDVASEQKMHITVEQASNLLRDAKGWGSKVKVGLVAHDVPLKDYLPLLKAVSENGILDLAFVEGAKPTFINENIKKCIERGGTGQPATRPELESEVNDKP